MIPKKYYNNPETEYCDDNEYDDGFNWVHDEDFDIDLI
jgi:hypothetical protein